MPFDQIQTILVPQGAEYRAVCRGLRHHPSPPEVLAIPVGPTALRRFLQAQVQAGYFSNCAAVLVMGLCGSLVPQLGIADWVLYQNCRSWQRPTDPEAIHGCDRTLTEQIQTKLCDRALLVKAFTSDRVIYSAQEKQTLAQNHGVEVVDMEGFPALELLTQAGIAVAMLRVVSDDCQHDVPDLTAAINPNGGLQIGAMLWRLLRQPIAGFRLIRGSLHGLKALQDVTVAAFQ